MNGFKLRKNASLILQYVFVVFMTLIVLVPILILIIASFKTTPEFTKSGVFELPKSLYLDNYKMVFERGNFLVAFKNVFILFVASTLINVVLGSMLAYALGRFQFRGKNLILVMIMGARCIPTVTTQVATFTIIKSLGFYNTLIAPVLLYAGSDVVQIILFLQFVQSIPYSLDESARMDGASYLRIYWSIILPLLKPATVTVIILKIVTVYNDMYIPYLYMPSTKLNVVSTAIMKFCGSNYGSQIPMLAAAFILVMLPVLIFYIVVQKQLFDGITAGAVKE